MKLIEVSFAQLFLVAARHCTEPRDGWDPDVILHRGSPDICRTSETAVAWKTSDSRASHKKKKNITPLPFKDNPAVLFTIDCRSQAWLLRVVNTVILLSRQPQLGSLHSGVTRQRKHRFDTFDYSKKRQLAGFEAGFAYLA